jgi:PKD repeat protein/KaiC/GvpD/RAD55 family RecA-like ATPase
MRLHDSTKQGFTERREILREVIVCFFLLSMLCQFLSFNIAPVHSQSSSLLVFAEASSFARLDNIDPSGWFYQAVLYNPTDSDIVVTGLRWWYNSSVNMVEASRDARCYDRRHFSVLPVTNNPDSKTIWWEYAPGSISITAPAKRIIITWIEVPTRSVNGAEGISETYYVQAYVDTQWLSSPLYVSHGGDDNAASAVFRADFDLTTDPNSENQTHPNPEWLFKEDRSVIANLSTRVRVIPVATSRNTLGIKNATISVILPSGWGYVPSSAYNPYGENITPYSVGGRDALMWDMENRVFRYYTNQSMAQNYIEFNLTSPYVPGIYNLTVTSAITSLGGMTTTENQYIYVVVKTPPIASFTSSPRTPLTGENVTFNATASYDLDGRIMDYFWDFGDGNNGTGNVTTHAYADNGNYTVTLTITDNDGLRDTALDTIIVEDRPPIAQFTESAEIVDTGVVIYLNASESYDPDGFIVSYFWDFGDMTNATGMIVNHAYTDDANYTVILTVTDNDGAIASANSTKTVSDRSPVALFTESATTAKTGEDIYFNASRSYDPDGYIVDYFWDFGDGTNATGMTVSHAYAKCGNYTVELAVTDDDGTSATTADVKTVLDRAPVALFMILPQQPIVGETIIFNATSSYDSDGTIVNYTWNFEDGNITTTSGSIITHVYSESGNFNVSLTVLDNDGYNGSTSQFITIRIHDVAIINVNVSGTDVHIGQLVNITVTAKNEGTSTESFNVSVFRNETIIGTQLISDLAPGAEKILNFCWNTSDVTDTANFLIQAKADVVPRESDVVDNTYVGDVVKVSKVHPSSFSLDWSWILLIGIPSIIFFAIGVLWKKKNAVPSFRDFDFFDEITDGGIPYSFSILIMGGPGSGKSMLCQQLTHKFLTNGEPCVYVTYDCFPDEVRKNMEKFHWDLSQHEHEGKFMFVDCFSSIANVASGEKHSVSQPFSFSDLGITMSKATSEKADAPRVFLDSIVPLLTHVEPSKVVEFLQDRSARIKGINGTFIFTVGKETIESNLLSRLEELADCTIELDISTSQGKTIRRLRIKRMRGRKASDKWIRFEISSKGIIFPV